MKYIYSVLIVFAVFLVNSVNSSSYADFVGAMDNYANGDHESAYREFMQLAAVGNAEAIYNIGLMYSQGVYVEQSYEQAYAWMKIANSFNEQYSTVNAKNKLSITQASESEAVFLNLEEQYGSQSYTSKLQPFVCSREDYLTSKEPVYTAVKQIKPKAPSTARRKQVNGYINVGYSINAEGKVVDVDLLDEFPRGLGYAVETMRAVKKFEYPLFETLPNQVPLRYATYDITFHTKKWSKVQAEHSKASVAKFIEMANADNSRAQYLLATAVPGLFKAKIDYKKRNELLELSAKNGYHQAQLIIGLRLIQDTQCRSSKRKGERWIEIAAENGNQIAQKFVTNFIDFKGKD